MATLKVKNKYQLTFIKLVNSAKEEGGIPDIIEIDGHEAWQVLNEMRVLGNQGFSIVDKGFDPQFILRSSKDVLDRETAQDLITRWWKKEFSISFVHTNKELIPLVVANKKKVQQITGTVNTTKVDKPKPKDDNKPTE